MKNKGYENVYEIKKRETLSTYKLDASNVIQPFEWSRRLYVCDDIPVTWHNFINISKCNLKWVFMHCTAFAICPRIFIKCMKWAYSVTNWFQVDDQS